MPSSLCSSQFLKSWCVNIVICCLWLNNTHVMLFGESSFLLIYQKPLWNHSFLDISKSSLDSKPIKKWFHFLKCWQKRCKSTPWLTLKCLNCFIKNIRNQPSVTFYATDSSQITKNSQIGSKLSTLFYTINVLLSPRNSICQGNLILQICKFWNHSSLAKYRACSWWLDFLADPQIEKCHRCFPPIPPPWLLSDCQWFWGSDFYFSIISQLPNATSCYCYLARENFHGPFPHVEDHDYGTDAHFDLVAL